MKGAGDQWDDAVTRELVVPCRWLFESLAWVYPGTDNNRCKGERNVSALARTATNMRGSLGPDKIEKMNLVRYNEHLVSRLA